MSRRAQFLEVLGIPAEWVLRQRAGGEPQALALPEAGEVATVDAPLSAAPAALAALAALAAPAVSIAEAPPVAEAPVGAPAQAAAPTPPAEAPLTIDRAPAMPSLVPAGPEPGSAQVDREADIATMDWPALEAAVAGCTACGLCQTRTNTVFGVGDRQAEWMLIGEAPGENEDQQGEPFVGQAGKLLDNMLGALGLARGRNVFIANVLKCRPPGNRNPEPDEVAQCEPFLRRQIALVKPKVIVVLGRFAAQSLLRSTTPIGKLRGTVHTYEGIPVVVTYHPAYLLRTLTDKARAWEDLCLAREVHDRAGAGA
ncbi:uracil-DNA glycosylase [Cupriavidus necator]